jgi:hypothetical protein
VSSSPEPIAGGPSTAASRGPGWGRGAGEEIRGFWRGQGWFGGNGDVFFLWTTKAVGSKKTQTNGGENLKFRWVPTFSVLGF